MIGPGDFGTWLGIGAAAIGAAFAAYKKWSRDSTDISNNKEEKNWVVRVGKELENERKRAFDAEQRERQVWEQHIEDAEAIAKCEAARESLLKVVESYENRIDDLQRVVWEMATPEQRKILGNKFAELKLTR